MVDYDFSTLNDKEFENLSIELISIDKNKKFERFKAGKDGGIDGRYYHDDGTQEIIQCKHYLKTGFDGLISSLKKKKEKSINEIEKVQKLNPKKYIFVTSLPLSAKNKATIIQLFTPYIESDKDIYGQENLNDLLKNNPDIEERHYKLWLSSSVVLQRILNNAIKGRSEYLIQEIQEKAKRYVITDNHHKALEKLQESHTIIIAGEPGIGKTTLAEHLALIHMEKGFEFCVIENSLNEAEHIFDPETKQLFYFDDFLGSTYLEALEFHQDSHIINFIARVKKNKNKRFILTSRTNIFNQSLQISDIFKNNKIAKDEFIIKVDNLSNIEKAKILYNHIWHSNLEEPYIDELYKEKRYREIINNKNFNPRLIEFVTDIDRLDTIKENEYWEFIKDKLNNPADVWTQTFDHQSDEYIRNLVILTVFNGNRIEENILVNSYDSINKRMMIQNNSHVSKDFDNVIKSVVKYFLNRSIIQKTVIYTLFNPSIADFIISRYSKDEYKLTQTFLSLKSLGSLKVLRDLHSNKKISKQFLQKIIIQVYEELDINLLDEQGKIDYTIQLFEFLELYYDLPFDKQKMVAFYEMMLQELKLFTLHDEYFFVLTRLLWKEELCINSFKFLVSVIEDADAELRKINRIIEFLKDFKIYDDEVIESLNCLVHKYLVNELDGAIADMSIDDVDFDHDYEGYVSIRSTTIDSYIENHLNTLINEINEFEKITIDDKSIQSEFNTSSIEENLVNAYYKSFGENEKFERYDENYVDNIDDLFER